MDLFLTDLNEQGVKLVGSCNLLEYSAKKKIFF